MPQTDKEIIATLTKCCNAYAEIVKAQQFQIEILDERLKEIKQELFITRESIENDDKDK